MTWLGPAAIKDLLREASKRGSLRQRELSEHGREAYGTGPKARFRTGAFGANPQSAPTVYSEETAESYREERAAISDRKLRGVPSY